MQSNETHTSSLEGYQGDSFSIYGRVTYPDLSWGGALGLSIFVGTRSIYSAFREMYNLSWKPVGIDESPRTCPEFPAEKSVFLHQGKAFVCLVASES